jgi:hypothetical protein
MNMKKKTLFSLVALAVVLAAGCSRLFSFQNKTSPTSSSPSLSSGPWASVASSTSLVDTCTNFRWMVGDVTDGKGSGTFSATCLGTMQVSGTANGTINGNDVTWTATATGISPDGTACPISLTGTATFDGAQFRIPYTGTTCVGPVSGTEILRKS